MATKQKPSAASSQPEKLVRKSAADIRKWMKSPPAENELQRLEASGPDPSPDSLREIPELTDAELARCYPANKLPITVRIDPDVLAWLKGMPGKYQRHLNAILRAAMLLEKKRSASRDNG